MNRILSQDKNQLLGLLSEKNSVKGANLTGANLSDANLTDANLTGAIGWTKAQLLQAAALNGAIMPDVRLYEEWIKQK